MSDEALNKHLDWLDECDKARAKATENEKMKEPWIAKTCWDGNARFELHIGENIHVLSLEKGKRLAEDILSLLRELEDSIPF